MQASTSFGPGPLIRRQSTDVLIIITTTEPSLFLTYRRDDPILVDLEWCVDLNFDELDDRCQRIKTENTYIQWNKELLFSPEFYRVGG